MIFRACQVALVLSVILPQHHAIRSEDGGLEKAINVHLRLSPSGAAHSGVDVRLGGWAVVEL